MSPNDQRSLANGFGENGQGMDPDLQKHRTMWFLREAPNHIFRGF